MEHLAFLGKSRCNLTTMEKRNHLYVSHKNVLAWLMAACMIGSAVTRIVFACMKGTSGALYVWSQIVLPVAAAFLYASITLLHGRELFYKTAIPVWMAAVYFGFVIFGYFGFSKMICWLYWIVLLFFGIAYTMLSSGKFRYTWLLLPVLICPGAAIVYLHSGELRSGNVFGVLPNGLMVLGWILTVFAIQLHPAGEYHPTWGDRTDGRRLRSLPPMSQVSPYIMVERNAASNLYCQELEITRIDRYIRQKRREGMTGFGIMHVILAGFCRASCRYPGVNRFLSGQKVYSRGDDLQICLTVKKEMTVTSPDTVIKVHLKRGDTAQDVYRKMNAAVEEVKSTPLDSSFDNLANLFTLIPGVFLKFTLWLLKTMDYFGLLPSILLELSPFHGSLFITNLGSLGISPVYHHLYDFGNLPMFCAFGRKRHVTEVQEDGTVVTRKYVDLKFTLDERTVDGYYYAAFFKHYLRIMATPESLDLPPEEILPDID